MGLTQTIVRIGEFGAPNWLSASARRLPVFPPADCSPKLTAPGCPQSCLAPLGELATAADILIHVVDHSTVRALRRFSMPREDEARCMQFVQADYPARLMTPECGLLLLSLRRIPHQLPLFHQF